MKRHANILRSWYLMLSFLLTIASRKCPNFQEESAQSKNTTYAIKHPHLYIPCQGGATKEDCVFRNAFLISGKIEYRFGCINSTHNAVKRIGFTTSTVKRFPRILLDTFPRVEILHLCDLQMRSIEQSAFQSGGRIRQLFLSNNDIDALADDAFDGLRLVEHISLDGNRLTKLPSNIFLQTSRLQTLTIARNNLHRIDVEAWHLSTGTLAYLDASNNRITHFDFTSLQSLLEIDVSCNVLPELAVPRACIYLNASHNYIRAVTGRSKSLRLLSVSHNHLNDTAFVQHFPNLAELYVSYNKLEDVAYEHFSPLTRLQVLLLDNNHLFTVDLSPPLPMLTVLDLSHNNLLYLDGIEDQVDKLESLSIQHNSIVTMRIGTKNRLKSISVSHNDWDCENLRQLAPVLSNISVFVRDETCPPPYVLVHGICCRESHSPVYLERLIEHLAEPCGCRKEYGTTDQCALARGFSNEMPHIDASALDRVNFHELDTQVESIKSTIFALVKLHRHIHAELPTVPNFQNNSTSTPRVLSEHLAYVIGSLKQRTLKQLNRQMEVNYKHAEIVRLEQEVIRLQVMYARKQIIIQSILTLNENI